MNSDNVTHDPRSSACHCESCKELNNVTNSAELSSCSSMLSSICHAHTNAKETGPQCHDQCTSQSFQQKQYQSGRTVRPGMLRSEEDSNNSHIDVASVRFSPLMTHSLQNLNDSELFGDGTSRLVDENRCSSDSLIAYRHRPCQSTQTECTCGPTKSIYVTVADDSEQHATNVADICKRLSDKGYKINFDFRDEFINTGIMNVHEWRDRNFVQAHRVLICISPNYFKYTFPEEEANPHPDDNRLAVRYVFSLIRNEISQNQCINKRFVPVVFTDVGGRKEHIPQCLQPFGVLYYPRDKDKIMDYIVKSR